jgi:hypothetical protein
VLFSADAHPGLARGDITLTFRTWRRPQVRVGGAYRVGGTTLVVDEVGEVRVGDITEADARRAGAADRRALLDRMATRRRGRYSPAATFALADDTRVWRVAFHREEADEDGEPRLADRDDLTAEDRAGIDRRLERLDAAGAAGPWTRPTLALIATHPGVVSTTLAATLGRERMAFKADVRKLKRLGLTESLRTGYRLSPRGRAYLAGGPG